MEGIKFGNRERIGVPRSPNKRFYITPCLFVCFYDKYVSHHMDLCRKISLDKSEMSHFNSDPRS